MSETEKIERLKKQIEALSQKDALSKYKDNAAVKDLIALQADYKRKKSKAKLGYSPSSPTNFTRRIESHTKWLHEIKAEKELADLYIEHVDTIKALIDEVIIDLAKYLDDGGDDAIGESNVLLNTKLSQIADILEEIRIAEETYHAAKQNRVNQVERNKQT